MLNQPSLSPTHFSIGQRYLLNYGNSRLYHHINTPLHACLFYITIAVPSGIALELPEMWETAPDGMVLCSGLLAM